MNFQRFPIVYSWRPPSVVIYPLVIRSIFDRFPFWKGKNEEKQMNIKGKRNDTTATADTKN